VEPPADSSSTWPGAKLTFEEGFEFADLDTHYGNGFSWDESRRMSIANQGFTGDRSLQFNFPAGENGFSEQRFTLDKAYPDIWIGYRLRVPDNWEHGSSGPAGNNNKFFAIWMDRYAAEGPTGVFATRPSSGDSRIMAIPKDRYNDHPGEKAGGILIRVPEDRGRWMHVVIHAKMASSADRADGVFELFRRWEGESKYTEIYSTSDWPNYHIGGNRGFRQLYLMGWANADQPQATQWLLDDFVVSETSLLELPSKAEPTKPEPVIPSFILP